MSHVTHTWMNLHNWLAPVEVLRDMTRWYFIHMWMSLSYVNDHVTHTCMNLDSCNWLAPVEVLRDMTRWYAIHMWMSLSYVKDSFIWMRMIHSYEGQTHSHMNDRRTNIHMWMSLSYVNDSSIWYPYVIDSWRPLRACVTCLVHISFTCE